MKSSVKQLVSADLNKLLNTAEKLKLHSNAKSFLAIVDTLSKHDINSTFRYTLLEAGWAIWKQMVDRGIELPEPPSTQGKALQWQSWWLENKSKFPEQIVPEGTTVEEIEKRFIEKIKKAE